MDVECCTVEITVVREAGTAPVDTEAGQDRAAAPGRNCPGAREDSALTEGDEMKQVDPQRRALLASAAALTAAPAVALAQSGDWPHRPIRLISPFGPGSATDTLARMLAEPLSHVLGQPVVVDPKPGANTVLATGMTAKSPPDGYTFLLATNSGLVASPGGLTDNVPYDTQKDFDYIALVARISYVLLVNDTIGAKTLRELVDLIRANPGKYTYASGNTGGIAYMGYLHNSQGLQMSHVAYKSAPPALVDVIAGHVPMMVSDVTTATPQVRAGKLRAIAVPSPRRDPMLPEVPTFAESGFPQPPDFDGWWMLTAPAGVPGPILDRMNTEVVAILNRPEVRKALLERGLVPVGSSRAEATRYQREQLQVWTRTIRELGLKAG